MKSLARWCMVVSVLACSGSGVHEEPAWIGLSEREITDRLGEPSVTVRLTLSSGVRLYEYQSGLYDHAPKGPGERLDVKELRWVRLLDTAAVWLVEGKDGEWSVLETLVWYRPVQF